MPALGSAPTIPRRPDLKRSAAQQLQKEVEQLIAKCRGHMFEEAELDPVYDQLLLLVEVLRTTAWRTIK